MERVSYSDARRDHKYDIYNKEEKMALKKIKRKRIITQEHREKISHTLRAGYQSGRYDKPVGNTVNHCKGPRPWVWKWGPDPVRQAMNQACSRSKAQAHFRGEEWKIAFEDYEYLWKGKWSQRGRTTNALMLCRKDNTKPWSRANCYIGSRSQHFKHVNKNYKISKTFTKGFFK